MSKSIVNKTRDALSVPLPRGKALHLGPSQIGHLSPHDVKHPPLKKLIDAGKIEILDDPENKSIPTHGRRGTIPF